MINKTIFLMCVFFTCFFTTASIAQRSPEVSESVEKLANVTANSLVVTIPEAEAKEVEKAWRSSLTVYGGKIKKTKRALVAQPVNNMNISANPMIVYSKIEEKGGQVRLIAAFNTGENFISKQDDPTGYTAAETYLYNFAIDVAKQHVSEQLTDVDKEMSSLLKKNKDLLRKVEKLERSINSYESKIIKAKEDLDQTRKDISQNEADQAAKKQELNQIKDKERNINKM